MAFSVTILGSSSALPTSNRNLTAHLLNVDERFFLIDCGEGTQLQLRKYKAKLGRLNHIFITHLHGDHIFGLPGLISSLNLMGRQKALHIFAHSDLEKILSQFLANFYTKLEFPLVYHPLNLHTYEQIYEDKKMTVHSFPLKHRIPTCGFIFREKPKLLNIKKDMIDFYQISIRDILSIKLGSDYTTSEGNVIPNGVLTIKPNPLKSYAFCSDTAYNEEIVSHIKNVELLYHESTFSSQDKARAIETYHSTAADAATIALKANAKSLVIGHFSARYKDIESLLHEAKEIFPNCIAAEDGLTLEI